MKLSIRNARPSDAPFIARAILEAVGFENPSAEILEQQAAMCARPDVLYSWLNTVVAESNGQVVGSLTSYDGRHYRRLRSVTFPLIKEMCGADFSDMPDETSAGEYYLDSLYVDAAVRRQGVATSLLRAGIARAQRVRSIQASLLVSPEKPDAGRLYEKVGFREKCRVQAFGAEYRKMTLPLSYPPLLEVCAASLSSARAADQAGAARIELCDRLDIGGVTPSHEDIACCVRELSLQTFVLIRPRGGDFCYSEEEMALILNDIRFCREIGVDGVVVGFLHEDGSIDEEYCRRALAEAYPMQVTFHRAFDRCSDWPRALEQIVDLGFHRILTSGQQPTAIEGVDALREMNLQADGRIIILAGSGIRSDNAKRVMEMTGTSEVHGSCKISGYESDWDEIKRTLSSIQ